MADENWQLKWELLVADVWDDPALKQRLLSRPEEVFKERGIEPPAGMKVNVVESTDETGYFVLPPAPSEVELSEEELESVAGGQNVSITIGCSPGFGGPTYRRGYATYGGAGACCGYGGGYGWGGGGYCVVPACQPSGLGCCRCRG
jgi:hypothetical protein